MGGLMDADLLDRIGQAAMDARQVIREAHEAQQDLKMAIREYREAITHLRERTNRALLVSQQDIADTINRTIEQSSEAIYEACLQVVGEKMEQLGQVIDQELTQLRDSLSGRLDLRLERFGDQLHLFTEP
jgi:hypothetical protein